MRLLAIHFAALAAILLYTPISNADEPPLPADLVVWIPSIEVPSQCAAFSGGWVGGAWGGRRESSLWVTYVDSKCNAQIIVCWGSAGSGTTAGCRDAEGTISDGKLKFDMPVRGVITPFSYERRKLKMKGRMLDARHGRLSIKLSPAKADTFDVMEGAPLSSQ